MGFNDNAVAQGVVSADTDADLAKGAGATVERVTFNWRWAEPNPGEYHLDMYDRIYAALRARGIRPLFILLFSPPWAWAPEVQCSSYCMYPPGAAHFDDAGRMAALLATRYPEAAGIEVWNEPNLSAFWRPQPDPTAYVGLLKATHAAVKRANPAMPVVGGGFNNVQNTIPGRTIALPDFLGAVYALGGGPSMDAIGFHPYPLSTSNSLLLRSVDQVRELLHLFSDQAKRLWVTEVGLTTTDPAQPVSEAQQAEALVSQYRTLRAMPDIDMVLIHTLIEFGEGATDKEMGYGIVRPDLSLKPAYCALAREWGGAGCLPT